MAKDIREKILEAAKELFTENGIRHTTVETIAKRAGIGKGTIYNYFDSKEEIFSEVVHREGEILYDRIDKAVRGVKGVREKLYTFVITKVGTIKGLMNLYRISKEMFLQLSEEVKYEMQFLYEKERLLVEHILVDGQRRGEVSVEDPTLVSHVIISALKDLELRWIVDDSIEDVERYLNVLLDILFFGMAPRKSR